MAATNDPNDPRRDDVPAPRVTEDGITEIGFDDPELRPLPADKLHYHVPHPDPRPEMHEHSDVPIRPLAIAIGSIVALCLVSFVLLYFLFWSYDRQQRAQEKPRTAVPMAKAIVPEPRLQGVPGFNPNHPTKAMSELRDAHGANLESYGKTPDGAVTIPLERAMDLALERKLFPVGNAPGAGQAVSPAAPGAPSTPRPERPNRPQGQGGQ